MDGHSFTSGVKIKIENEYEQDIVQKENEPKEQQLQLPELNIKTEFEYHEDDRSNDLINVSTTAALDVHHNSKRMKSEDTSSGSKETPNTSQDDGLSTANKLTLLRTCISLLDSSSDEDELLVWWLYLKEKKKTFRKRRLTN